MEILSRLLRPQLKIEDFLTHFYGKKPFASPNKAHAFCNLLSWPELEQVARNHVEETWPVRRGQISKEFACAEGRLLPGKARAAFDGGHSIVIRHAERSHSAINKIAHQFQNFFDRPIDVQVYVTPKGEEGFDWHYDIEEVFVIQTQGMKEFRMLANTVTQRPLPLLSKTNSKFAEERREGEIRCLLHAGDWLYIPSGYWHKAQAIENSFHISIGVMQR